MNKVYEYQNCSTCKKALKFLENRKIPYKKIAIVDTPPSLAELKLMLSHLKAQGKGLKNLFNTSGEQYRSLKISQKLAEGLSENEALALLSKNGKLIKRPFLLTEKGGTTGFQEDTWKQMLA